MDYQNFSTARVPSVLLVNSGIIQETPQLQTQQQHQQNIDLGDVERDQDVERDNTDSQSPSMESAAIDAKINAFIYNNSWNDKNERLIISIGENAASYKWMHETSSQFYNVVQRVMGILLVIFNTGLSAQTLIADSENNVSVIFRRMFTYIVTLVSVFQNFLKLGDTISSHNSSAMRFSDLYHDIQQQMCMYRKDRKNAVLYIQEMLKKYDSIVLSSPDVPTHVLNKFKKLFTNSDISIPSIADRIQRIDIVSEASQRGVMRSKGVSTAVDVHANKTTQTQLHNLSDITHVSNTLCIDSDITDRDLQTLGETRGGDAVLMRDLKHKMMTERTKYELERARRHPD